MTATIVNPVIDSKRLRALTQAPTVYQRQAEQIEQAEARQAEAEERATQLATMPQPVSEKLTWLEQVKKATKAVWGIVKAVAGIVGVALGVIAFFQREK